LSSTFLGQSILDLGTRMIARSTYPPFADDFAICLSLRHSARIKSLRVLPRRTPSVCAKSCGLDRHVGITARWYPEVYPTSSPPAAFTPFQAVVCKRQVLHSCRFSSLTGCQGNNGRARTLSISLSLSLGVSERKDARVTLRRESA